MEMKLLTGAVLDVRKWKLAEMELLLQAQARTFLSTLLKVFEMTTVSVVDPGIYGSFSWWKCYEGDLYDALWQFRALSVSPTYSFSIRCPNRRCQKDIEFDKPISEVRRNLVRADIFESLKNGENKITLPWSKGTITFLIPTAEQAIALLNSNRSGSVLRQKGEVGPVAESSDRMTEVLKTKLLRVVSGEGSMEASALRNWIDDIDLGDAGELFGILEEATFGVDTGMEITCGECGTRWDAEVPMTRSFFLPKKTHRPG
jgi:hypothetical protein